jgi:hypothetical protein
MTKYGHCLAGHDPTFVPTDVRFQTYPHRDENSASITSIDGNGRLNYILYLEMTDNATPPTGDDEFLQPNNGNWTNGTDPSRDGIEEFGSCIFSRQKFLESYFIPRLKKLNRMMSASYNNPSMSFDANLVRWWCSFTFPVVVGDHCSGYTVKDPADDEYALTYSATQPQAVTDVVNLVPDGFSELASGALCWYHSKAPANWTKHDSTCMSTCDSYAESKPF